MREKNLPPPEVSDKPSEVISPPKEPAEVELREAPDTIEPVTVKKEGKAHTKKADKKARTKKEKPAKAEVKFPIEGKMNKWEYIHVGREVLAKLRWAGNVEIPLSLDVKDGALVIRKK